MLAGVPARPGQPRTRAPEPPLWRFGFRHFRQVKYYGFEVTRPSYLGSLFERLSVLSNHTVDEILNTAMADNFRMHPVRWGDASNFTRAYFNWVPAEILDNEDDYPFLQFSVSTSLGRVVGFLDADQVFQVIVLDPQHNIQKSKGLEGRRSTDPVRSDYHDLRAQVDRAIGELDGTDKGTDKCRTRLVRAITEPHVAGDDVVRVVVELDPGDAEALHDHMIATPGCNARQVVEAGLQSFLLAADTIIRDVGATIDEAAPTQPDPDSMDATIDATIPDVDDGNDDG